MPAANGEDGGALLPTADHLKRPVSGSRKSSVDDVDWVVSGLSAFIGKVRKRTCEPREILASAPADIAAIQLAQSGF